MPTYTEEHNVLLNLAAQKDFVDDDGRSQDFMTNRIALKADSVSISTTKNVLSTPLPFAGIYYGEAQNVALDWGNSSKAISISGIITEQTLKRQFPTDTRYTDGKVSRVFTPQEIAQLIHASVDSSFMQRHQNITSIIILIPTRVDKNYEYHSATAETDDVSLLPKIPFTYKVRGGEDDDKYDATQLGGIGGQAGTWPNVATAFECEHIPGFIRSFNTNHLGGQPFVEFSLDFEVASNPITG